MMNNETSCRNQWKFITCFTLTNVVNPRIDYPQNHHFHGIKHPQMVGLWQWVWIFQMQIVNPTFLGWVDIANCTT